jgi:hypothetical protein
VEDLLNLILSSSLLVSIVGVLVTEYYRVRSEKELRKFQHKEERYVNMLSNFGGFRVGKIDVEKQERFYQEYSQLWLYASDETIRSVNSFWIATGATQPSELELSKADKATCQMILQLRKDFYGETQLKPEEFLIVRPSQSPSS